MQIMNLYLIILDNYEKGDISGIDVDNKLIPIENFVPIIKNKNKNYVLALFVHSKNISNELFNELMPITIENEISGKKMQKHGCIHLL